MIDFKSLCEAAFKGGRRFVMLVYVGRKDEERPVFSVVIASVPCRLRLGSKGREFWGIVAIDPATGERQWYNYNDCVSLEKWAVLDRFIQTRFGWMELADPALVMETRALAKAQLREGLKSIDLNKIDVL